METPTLRVRQIVYANFLMWLMKWLEGEEWNYAFAGSGILIPESDPLYLTGKRIRIFDGAHRALAAEEALKRNPKLPIKVYLHVFPADTDHQLAAITARRQNSTQSKGNTQSLIDDLWSMWTIVKSLPIGEVGGATGLKNAACAAFAASTVSYEGMVWKTYKALMSKGHPSWPRSPLEILFGLQVRVPFGFVRIHEHA
jgi:hypothetical protein